MHLISGKNYSVGNSDLIKRAGKGEITMLLIHLQNYPNRLQVRARNGSSQLLSLS